MNAKMASGLGAALLMLILTGCPAPTTDPDLTPEVTERTCSDFCGLGAACVNGTCVPLKCEPACGAGMACQDGACVAVEALSCAPSCGACQVCDTSGQTPACVDLCGGGESCENNACVVTNVHQSMLTGVYASGTDVTTACLSCHRSEAEKMLTSPHFKWLGATPGLAGHETGATVGKRNLINNFCVAVSSNEKRCTQCHAGYGSDPVKDQSGQVVSGGPAWKFPAMEKVDCLICHADLKTGYVKATADWGKAAVAGIADPAADPEYATKLKSTLLRAAQSVGRPGRDNCGFCHFIAGGGDNVKMGDLGTALKSPTAEADVHMGNGMVCADCHAAEGHVLRGSGTSIPVVEGAASCNDCHTTTPHEGTQKAALDNHALDLACQSCHIPGFSRQQPTKMVWNWSTAGDKQNCQGATPCANGVSKVTVGGKEVEQYNWMKGSFEWRANVRPAYRWYEGKARHQTISDAYDPTRGGAEGTPVVLAEPTSAKADTGAKIYPFKLMKGQQAAMKDGRFVIVPKLFGVDGFWGKRADGTPVVPGTYNAQTVQGLWTEVLTAGARTAGQLTSSAPALTNDDWRWAFTEMYLNINHEVAPASSALGCSDCHGSADFDFQALGYACDPMTGGNTCGSRH